MSETEVTVEVFEDLDSIRRALLSKGFAMTGKYLIRDRYYTGLGDVSGLTYGELIGNSFLIRCIDGPAPVKLLMFKKKEIDASGVVVSEEKVKTVLEDPETDRIIADTETQPFMADRRLVVVRDFPALTGRSEADEKRQAALMSVMDGVNAKYGRGRVRLGAEGLDDAAWQMRQGHRSPRYTTRWDELPVAKC